LKAGTTMLRVLLIVLILANGLFWAWREGWLSLVGMAPQPQREPQRLEQQVAADMLRLLPADKAARAGPVPAPASAPAPVPPAASAAPGMGSLCVQTPVMTATAASAAEAVLVNALPGKPWQRVTSPAQDLPFAVAMTGLSGQALVTKQKELERLAIKPEVLRTSAGAVGGLILGRYADQAQANNALAAYAKRGVRTARVVTLAEPTTNVRLRIDPVSDDVAGILRGWNAQATESTTFRPCTGG
jgi:hypothetical protein